MLCSFYCPISVKLAGEFSFDELKCSWILSSGQADQRLTTNLRVRVFSPRSQGFADHLRVGVGLLRQAEGRPITNVSVAVVG